MLKQVKKLAQNKINLFLIINTVVWGLVIIGVAVVVRGSGYTSRLCSILSGGAFISVIVLGFGLLKTK